jgi:hypothetical protein
MKRLALLFVGASAFAVCTAQAEDVACPNKKCQGKAVLREKDGRCQFEQPSKDHKFDDAHLGDVVRWEFENNCAADMEMRVGDMMRHSKARCTTPSEHATHLVEPIDKNPFEGTCNRRVMVKGHGGTGAFDCAIRKNALAPRTYKYSLIGSRRLKLDPEIEILP